MIGIQLGSAVIARLDGVGTDVCRDAVNDKSGHTGVCINFGGGDASRE